MAMRDWVRLPTDWIRAGGLRDFKWDGSGGSDNVAALMVLMAISHHADKASGIAKLTYADLETCTNLSREKLSKGLSILQKQIIIEREPKGRSTYGLARYGSARWGKLPARRMYQHGAIAAFQNFHLRRAVELNALKLFFLIVERRNIDTNVANIGFDKIHELSGIQRHHIKSAASLLVVNGLLYVEHVARDANLQGISNAYRLPYIEPYNHAGTKGRGSILAITFDSEPTIDAKARAGP